PSPLAFAGLSLFSWSSAAPWSPAGGLLSWPTRFSRRPWSRRYSVLKFNRGRDIPLDRALRIRVHWHHVVLGWPRCWLDRHEPTTRGYRPARAKRITDATTRA